MYSSIISNFKTLSTEEDNNFVNHLIQTKYLKRLTNSESDIVFGSKGSGKTALNTALAKFNKETYLNTYILNLNSLSFNRLLNNIQELEYIIKEDKFKISRIAWKNTLLNAALFSLSEINDDLEKKNAIINVLNEDGFIKGDKDLKKSDEKVNIFLEKINNFLDKSPFSEESLSSFYSSEINSSIEEFPLNKNTRNLLNSLCKDVYSKNKKILVCIDGLDSIADHSYNSRNVIFTGLIDAIYHLRLDKSISNAFIFKGFFPQELTIDIDMKIWDSDKHINNTHFISWNKKSLKDFVLKRLFRYSSNNSNKFDDVWKTLFPEKIQNNSYNVEENTFDYLIRHTLYRPRQLQQHIYEIFKNWIEAENSEMIHPNFIPKIVSLTNKTLSRKIAEQLSFIYPNIIVFLKSFNNESTVITFKDFKTRISKKLLNSYDTDKDINTIVDELYLFGIFGIEKDKNGPNFKNKTKEFYFSFVNTNDNHSISQTINEESIIGISPMLREFCNMKKDNKYIIKPICINNYY